MAKPFRSALTLFRQLPYHRALAQAVLRLINKMFDKWATGAYGQTGEDRIVASLLSANACKFYVDVGCHHPRRYSNTFALYLNGWRGVTIDADSASVRAHKRERPKDVQVCGALSSRKGESALFTEFAEPAVSSLSEGHVEEWRRTVAVVGRRNVTTTTLNEVLREHRVAGRFGLLSIDVEGHDLEVLRGLDLERFRPELIVVEMHGFALKDHETHPIVEHLRNADYELKAFAVMNGYFLDARAIQNERHDPATLRRMHVAEGK